MKRGTVMHYTREQIINNMKNLRDALIRQNPKSEAIVNLNRKLAEMEADTTMFADGANGIW